MKYRFMGWATSYDDLSIEDVFPTKELAIDCIKMNMDDKQTGYIGKAERYLVEKDLTSIKADMVIKELQIVAENEMGECVGHFLLRTYIRLQIYGNRRNKGRLRKWKMK